MNIGKRINGLSYDLVVQRTGLPKADTAIACSFEKSRYIDQTATEAMKQSTSAKGASDDIKDAMELIRVTIETNENEGRLSYAKEMQALLRERGFGLSTERSACRRLKVNRLNKEPGQKGRFHWTLMTGNVVVGPWDDEDAPF